MRRAARHLGRSRAAPRNRRRPRRIPWRGDGLPPPCRRRLPRRPAPDAPPPPAPANHAIPRRRHPSLEPARPPAPRSPPHPQLGKGAESPQRRGGLPHCPRTAQHRHNRLLPPRAPPQGSARGFPHPHRRVLRGKGGTWALPWQRSCRLFERLCSICRWPPARSSARGGRRRAAPPPHSRVCPAQALSAAACSARP